MFTKLILRIWFLLMAAFFYGATFYKVSQGIDDWVLCFIAGTIAVIGYRQEQLHERKTGSHPC